MSASALTVLGIETSCDETAAAVVRLGPDGAEILSDIVLSQVAAHAPYKGVVPEIAARAHVEGLDGAIAAAMSGAGVSFSDLNGVAATAGPGLIGGVMVGLVTAKSIALAHDLPLIAVNHLEGHALSPRLGGTLPFPYLLLLVSGGHCQFLAVRGLGDYQRLGSTLDDALGEAFDKTAKLLDLGMPGGPAVERLARDGDGSRFDLPRPLKGRPGCDFSFAGLKTAVAREVELFGEAITQKDKADLCAAFQEAVLDVVSDRTRRAIVAFEEGAFGRRLVAAGGVAANVALRSRLEALAAEAGYSFTAPPMRFCTDNAVMIALAGAERMNDGFSDLLNVPARPRWPLDENSALASPTHSAGRKGPKA